MTILGLYRRRPDGSATSRLNSNSARLGPPIGGNGWSLSMPCKTTRRAVSVSGPCYAIKSAASITIASAFLNHLQMLVMIVLPEPQAFTDNLEHIEDAERPVTFARAQFAMIGMIDERRPPPPHARPPALPAGAPACIRKRRQCAAFAVRRLAQRVERSPGTARSKSSAAETPEPPGLAVSAGWRRKREPVFGICA